MGKLQLRLFYVLRRLGGKLSYNKMIFENETRSEKRFFPTVYTYTVTFKIYLITRIEYLISMIQNYVHKKAVYQPGCRNL